MFECRRARKKAFYKIMLLRIVAWKPIMQFGKTKNFIEENKTVRLESTDKALLKPRLPLT